MHASFTGSARRPRQVNLSGRTNPNPFAKPGASSAPSSAVANAQQNRIARQQERHRIQAAASVQRVWRGYSARQKIRAEEREQWDAVYAQHVSDASQQLLYTQLIRLLRFFEPSLPADCSRLDVLFSQIQAAAAAGQLDSDQWTRALGRLENACLNGLVKAPASQALFTRVLAEVVRTIPELTANNSPAFYQALRRLPDLHSLPLDLLLAPLVALNETTVKGYQNLALNLLTLPDLRHRLGGPSAFSNFAGKLNSQVLTAAVAELLKDHSDLRKLDISGSNADEQATGRLWLLGHLIYLNRHVYDFRMPAEHALGQTYTFVVAHLLSSVADDIRIEPPLEGDNLNSKSPSSAGKVVEPFLAEQISSLVNQDSIGGLTSCIGLEDGAPRPGSVASTFQENSHSRVLAGFILTLLRLFPRRGDDIRMWLYLGPSSKQGGNHHGSASIIQFFWQGVKTTRIFSNVYNDPRAAISLLKANPSSSTRAQVISSDVLEDEWRVVLLFVELYSFVLKVMDDEEFFAQSDDDFVLSSQRITRANSLSLDDLRVLSTFLKHLGFTMYYNASDILGSREEESAKDVASLFKSAPAQEPAEPREKSRPTTCIPGVGLDHMKGTVTGLLRAIYERDSRRQFMPRDHWLMISRFDMTNFIDAVVEEEERRNRVQEAEDDDDEEEDGAEDDWQGPRPLVGTGHAQRVMKIEQQRRQQRKQSRTRYLQAVAPRLEILQNMPFLIPFTTRVQIFRRFVHMDQIKRRDGTVDPELWRLSQMHGMDPLRHINMERHHAKVRRGHEFEDAFDEFFDLGAGLKEPINITFVDQFDQPEAGIDGGGVTKEFLTSVSNQAFAQDGEGVNLFIENDKNLIFPNPTAIEEQKELLRDAGFVDGSNMFRGQITDLLQRYEFLGRIIGKCLYEGILVDIGFAGFFLLKWALTGGSGVAPRESGYRANLNDLRDYDQGLYQGLIQLKNYPGDVEDFSLNFTVTDTLTIPPTPSHPEPRTKTITSELKPGGSQLPVTNANRLVYISYMARHRLTKQPFAQTSAFLRGLGTMVPAAWLSMFNQTELQTLVGGAQASINIPDLRAHTIYGGLYVIGDDGREHDSVRIFWAVMTELPDADRRKVLKFVTSTPRAPLLGFASLNPRFSIRDSGDDDRLPSTSTCVNLLKLPRYKSKESCRRKLLQAVNAGAGFDLS